MSIMAGILAGGQGLARGIDALGAQFADAREKEAFKQMLLNSGLVPQQQAAPMSLASLGQPNAPQGLSPMQAAPVAPVRTSAIPPINPKMSTPDNQGIMDRFAKEQQTAWGGPGLGQSSQATAFAPQASLVQSESGGRWNAQNAVVRKDGTVGHFGRLQFSQPRLAEAAAAGAIPQGTTPQQFMASPELQQRAEQWHFADIDNFIQQRGLDRAIGQQINGVPVTLEGMRAVAHLGGKQGLERFIQTGGQYNPADANGTSLMSYLAQHAGGGQARTNPLANVAPMQAPAPQQDPQQPMTLAQLAAPQQAPQMSLETLAGLATNRYGAPIAQQIIARQLGRDPMQQQLQQVQLAQALKALQGDPTREGLQTELLRAQVSQAQRQAAGDTQSTQDMREYALARQQGFTGSFLDYQQAKSAAKQKPGLSATDQKTIFAEEDKLPALDNTIQTLQRAKELNTKTYTGFTAGQRGTVMSSLGLGGEAASATREFNQIMGMEAIKSLSETMKGATTDREMAEFQSKIADPATPPEIRGRIIDRMLTLAQRQKQIAEGRVNELRAKGGQPPIANKQAPQIQPPANQGAISAARDAIAKGAPREAVIQRLRENGIDPAGL